jgi:hypothetical protein
MKFGLCRVLCLCLVTLVIGIPSVFAQKYEVDVYGGSNWGGSSSVGELKKNTLLGIKAGYFFDPNLEAELNLGYLPQFEVKSIDPKSRGWLWEAGMNLNFSSAEFPFKRQFTPFIAAGLGGITTTIANPVSFDKTQDVQFTNGTTLTSVNTYTITSGDTFFTFSYGGGIKSVRLAGPIGLRLDARGRTIPNYYGHSAPTWFELTGGVNFMWGER